MYVLTGLSIKYFSALALSEQYVCMYLSACGLFVTTRVTWYKCWVANESNNSKICTSKFNSSTFWGLVCCLPYKLIGFNIYIYIYIYIKWQLFLCGFFVFVALALSIFNMGIGLIGIVMIKLIVYTLFSIRAQKGGRKHGFQNTGKGL